METAEMSGKNAIRYQEWSKIVRKMFQTKNIVNWMSKRKGEWNDDISRMGKTRMVKIDNSLIGRCNIERPTSWLNNNLNSE